MMKELKRKLSAPFSVEADRGVSPVIGVILMVAITVILAAVIGAFVLGLGDGMDTGTQAGATITETDSGVTVTWNSGGNANTLTVSSDSGTLDPTSGEISEVGGTVSITGTGDTTVTVTAHRDDGSSAVVAQDTVNLG